MLDTEDTVEKKKLSIGAITFISVLAIIFIIIGVLSIMKTMGKKELTASISGDKEVNIGSAITPDEKDEESDKSKQILYDGKKYTLNDELISILVMGIDKETVTEIGGQSWDANSTGVNTGGQADALFLMLINPHDENVYIVAINRNTMADIDVWDNEGRYMGVSKKQIALQHGYGDGGTESCERQVKAVSRLFHNIPITSYVAISMDAIPALNDAVGGIDVTVLDDIIYPEYNMDLHCGDNVTLMGEQAYWYVRLRNENIFNSNELRLQRQKQYLTSFAAKAKSLSASDVRVAVDLYKKVSDYMVTDIDLNSFTYLVTDALNFEFQSKNIYSLKGEVVQGAQFEEFYAYDNYLQDLIIKLFYEEADDSK
ncbi:cell envelope-related function transcriptional attenuator common domain-containing protein [Acetitomaculum ruminis DSM 5522]|uniref:Cell envelope-related function transcriptional attenuator common domain-containing protein n=1 Tax=Acetitomaculum ruminis DSM 5522 TaxID=1120918 RepID=A0A1I0VK72_9FIRM|nr:LCP family protein [Acetitomaculum ruminis]SFA76722.1 cell envelope-related function transcriptional attenuator common domain-containing protein [Acetitomaculum ruminis DSM 5522]